MDEASNNTIHEGLARDLYKLVATHREEITRLMEEYDAHEIDTIVQLDVRYKRE